MNNLFKNMKIRTRLITVFMVVIAIMLAILLIAITNLQGTIRESHQTIDVVIDPLGSLFSAREAVERLKVEGRDMMTLPDRQAREAALNGMLERLTHTREMMQIFYDTIVLQEAFVLFAEFEQYLDNYEMTLISYRSSILDEPEAIRDTVTETLSPLSDNLLDIMATLNGLRLNMGRNLATSNVERAESAFVQLIIIAVAGMVIVLGLGIYFSISLSRPLIEGAKVISVVSGGDFTQVFPEQYGGEFGEFFKICNSLLEFNRNTIDGIRATAHEMRESATVLSALSSHMATNSKELSEKTASVSTVTEEFSAGMTQSTNSLSTASSHISAVASSIEEINSTISTVAAAAEETSTRVTQSSTLVDDIQDSISKASDSVNHVSGIFFTVADNVDEISNSISLVSEQCGVTKDKMSDADEKAKNTNKIIRSLEDASKQIGKIVSVISDIADQTNMLALNAAIEAAGAGEAGKGFMVVANEVKELAKQTTTATDEIADQIENMQRNMPEAVGAVSEITAIINAMTEYINSFAQEMNRQGTRSDQITEESADAARRMKEITAEINRISENAQSVTKTVVDSAKGVNEIAKSTAELVIGTQEIAMNSERASNNVSEINRTAQEMASGLVDISKNLQLINEEAGAVNKSAGSTNDASDIILNMANELEESVQDFKTS
ncbi:MAG: methyl-accepting chemotaxis protein [Oscillospiraceae bacterium]|nr:methyl-accepting chemotaxis protein [Oscillospiraceae bacterium]